MALRSGYKGYKKLAAGLKEFWPGILGVDNAALSKTFFPRSEQVVLGAYNILPFPYKTGSTTTANLTVAMNDDGTITLSTSAATSARVDIPLFGTYGSTAELLSAGDWIGTLDNSNSKVQMLVAYNTTTLGSGSDNVAISAPNGISYVLLRVESGTTLDSAVTIKPMISKEGGAYVPYAMTNKELTDLLSGYGRVLSSSDDLNDIKDTGIYGIFTAPTNSPIAPSSNPEEYAGLLVFNSGTSAVTQVVFRATGTRGNMYIRFYNGSWLPWMTFTGTAPT